MTIRWNEVAIWWNEVVMERSNRIPCKRFELRVMAAWFGAQTKTSFGTQSIISSTRKTSRRTLFSTGRASVLATTWVWFLNLDNGEVVETKL